MHKITFHNLGNADCIRIDLRNGKRVLFDYAHRGDPDDESDLRCDLPAELRRDLGDCDYFDVVAFTHLDNDHYDGATDFFYFEHIKKYQEDVDGKPRIKMNTLWVPAAVITEKLGSDADAEAKTIQKEARERFKAASGIRVFSRPDRLEDWCRKNGVNLDERRGLITDAGNLAPEFTLAGDNAEFFVHSPFAIRQDETTVENRNDDAIVMHVTLKEGGKTTKLFLTSDICDDVLADIVNITEANDNQVRLEWNVYKTPHHCSYKALNSEERGDDKTKPSPDVRRLLEEYSNDGCVVVSSSDTIPKKGEDRDTQEHPNPPHRQAANYYRQDVVADPTSDFLVTMERPSKKKPKPTVIKIDVHKATVAKAAATVSPAVSLHSPRAGWRA